MGINRVLAKGMKRCLILVVLLIGLLSPDEAAADQNTYPEEVHQRVLEKLSVLHGSPTNGRVGEWSDWSAWTLCSRTCGTGVSTQYRECLPSQKRQRNQKPESQLDNQCVGRYKRFQLCNLQTCPGGLVDFRAEQCSSFNRTPFNERFYSWEPFIDDPDSCTLNCRAVGMSFYATLNQSVVDGTSCGGFRSRQTSHEVHRICVEGKCMKLGCDGLLGSGRGVDACGVCGGDNSTCRLISGVYTRASLPFGYNLIATLPPGAKNLTIYHIKPSKNYLALRELGGNYILNGPWGLNVSGSFEASGTVFTYSRPHAHGGDHLYAKGPTTHSLDVMLFYQNANPGIKYEYRLPLSSVQRLPSRARGGPHLDSQNRVVIGGRPASQSSNKIPPGTLFPMKGALFGGLEANQHPNAIQSLPPSSSPHLLLADDPSRAIAYVPYQTTNSVHSNELMPFAAQMTINKGHLPRQSYLSAGFSPGHMNGTYPTQSKFSLKQKLNPLRNFNKFVSYSPKLLANLGQIGFAKGAYTHPNWNLRSQNSLSNNIPSQGVLHISAVSNHFSDPSYQPNSLNPRTSYHFNSVLPQHGPKLLQPFFISSPVGTFLPNKNAASSSYSYSPSVSPFSSSSKSSAAANQLLPPSLVVTNRTPDNKFLHANKHSPYIPQPNSVLLPFRRRSEPATQGIITSTSPKDMTPLYLEGGKVAWSSTADIKRWEEDPWKKQEFKKRKKQKTRKRYMWVSQGFTPCSRSCGGGTQSRRKVCVKRRKKDVEVPHEFCSQLPFHQDKVVRCNFEPCPPKWEATDWSDCSVTCGFGVQVRHLVCKQKTITDHRSIILADNECGKTATLPTAQVCQMRECDGPPKWDVGLWSDCSSQCGLGTRRRRVTCTTVQGEVEEELCKDSKPVVEEMCDMGSCASDTWFFSAWDTVCRGPCGDGVQTRRVHCSGDALEGVKESSSCPQEARPQDTRSCSNEKACGGSWFASPWSDCDTDCGTGRQRRAIVCVTWQRGRYKVARSPALCKAAGEKPLDSRPCAVECRARWFTSEWSECSLPCDGGVQRREVKCLDHLLQPSIRCSAATKPDSRQSCNAQSCDAKDAESDRLKNEVLDQTKHFPNDSSSLSNTYNSGKTYEYSEHRETSYVINGHTKLEPTKTFEELLTKKSEGNATNGNVSKLPLKTSEPDETGKSTNADDRDVYLAENRSKPLDVSDATKTSPRSNNSRNVGKRKEQSPVLPESTKRPGACIDRMKNCRLVFKARLCKLKYYNKLCCETCSKR